MRRPSVQVLGVAVMGWSLGEAQGRPVGYSVRSTCDHPGCTTPIDRGLSYACNEQHDEDTGDPDDCAGYFCPAHRYSHDCAAELTGVIDADAERDCDASS